MSQTLPLYAQLKETIIEAIERGELSAGQKLPSQRKLCEAYEMSHMTVRRAINELINEGTIFAIPGKGLYVAEKTQPVETSSLEGFEQQMNRLGARASTRMLDTGLINASTLLARQLGVAAGAPLVYLSRLRLADEQPLSITHVYLPHALCPGLLEYDLAANSLFETLRTVYGLKFTSSSAVVEAVLADEEQAALLNLSLPAALLFREQQTFLESGQIIELSRSYIRGDRYHIRVNEGLSPAASQRIGFEPTEAGINLGD